MDLYLKPGTAKSAVIWILNAIGVVLLLWAVSGEANTAQVGRDYLLPAEAKGGYISRPYSISSSRATSTKVNSTATTYKAFDGSTHQLVENRGRYVNVLLPQSYDDGEFFTADHIEEMVDRLDMLYALYTELLHVQPEGSDLLIVAFVPQTCGMGCGLVGARGFEVLSDPRNYEAIINELNAGRLESVLLHEMAHNFDSYSAYLHYLPDHAHAWTDMFEFFAPFRYSRISSHGESPDDSYNSPVSAVWKDFVTEESADWKHCVKEGSCGDMGLSANSLWAMLYYRVEALHGINAILDSFEYLENYIKTNPSPTTDEEKEGVRILSLAAGARANIACYMDALKWPIKSSIRTKLERSYGKNNEMCADRDGDGFSAVNGDCDDNNASRNIAVAEISNNGLDDDCDERVDEATLVEASAGSSADNFVGAVQTGIPFEVDGSGSDPEDRDSFRFSVPTSGRTRVTLCARGEFKGWVVALEPDGSFLEANNWYSYQSKPGCTSNTFDFGEFNNAGLTVMPDESEGEYTLTVTEAVELLPDYSPLVQVAADPSGGMSLQIDDKNELLSSLNADEIEVWISGAGVQLFEPFAENLSIELNRTTVPALRDGETYQVRIRPRANGLPLAAFSAGHLFRYDQSSISLPSIDDRFSGAWFDESHRGEGFIIEILKDDRALLYWFTYQDDGSQRWMLGVGAVQANRIVIDELLDTHGGRFGANFNPDDVVVNNIGSLSLSFLDCTTALVNYSVDNNGDHQSNRRLTQVYGHRCDSKSGAPEKDFSGSWRDPSHSGEGFTIEQVNADTALVFWFTYDDKGKQSWLFNTGTIDNGTIQIPQLLRTQGGRFGRSFDPDKVIKDEWGGLTLDLNCSGGEASYTPQVEGYTKGSQSLESLTRLAGSVCTD